MTPMDEWNRAVQGPLADADRVTALTEVEDARGNRAIVEQTIANARQRYIDLVRRSAPLIMSHSEQAALQEALDRLKERFGPFGDAV
jgi:gluconate kinase